MESLANGMMESRLMNSLDELIKEKDTYSDPQEVRVVKHVVRYYATTAIGHYLMDKVRAEEQLRYHEREMERMKLERERFELEREKFKMEYEKFKAEREDKKSNALKDSKKEAR